MSFFRTLIFTACSLTVGVVYAQQGIDPLVAKFNQYRTHTLQEKIYAHIDRTSYLTGELLWFKLYYVDGTLHKALNMSKVAYVEIIDRNNEAVVQTKVELNNGTGYGSLFIPAVLSSDNYVVRAYTHWMKNFSPEFYFHQPITIINPFIKSEQQQTSDNKKPVYDVQFFPEGGHTVVGIKNKIGFRVTDSSGKGIRFKGVVIDAKGDTVSIFSPLRFGIGHFYFKPAESSGYSVIISDENERIYQYPFPEIENVGYAMSVTDNGSHITIDVKSNGIKASIVYLFAHTRMAVIKTEAKVLPEEGVQFTISKSEFGEGITHLTIFDQYLKPMCERLFFKRPENRLDIDIRSSQEKYMNRDLVQLTLQTNTFSDVSVSIYHKDSIPSHDRHNIFEYLWLNSDLKGEIEAPGYYFEHADAEANIALDNLMLTHGWRRFRWNDVIDFNPDFKYIPEYRGHLIHGKITDVNGSPVAGVLSSFSWPNELTRFYGSRSNEAGDVRFEVNDSFDERRVFVHLTSRLDSAYSVKIENPFSTQYASTRIPSLQLSPSLSKQILNRSIAMQVQNTYSVEHINQFKTADVDSIPFYGKADRVYYLDDYVRFPLLEEVLREYVSGVFVRKRKDKFHFMLLDYVNNNTMMREEPLVLLDGVPVLDNNKLLEYSALKIKKIEVVGREYNLGPFEFSGILNFYTYKGDLDGFEIDTQNLALNYEGLQSRREFYSPLYSGASRTRNIRVPDKRTLLYWNPSLTVDGKEGTNVQFYTSDIQGEYEVVVEGITKDGVPGSSTHSFIVDNNKSK